MEDYNSFIGSDQLVTTTAEVVANIKKFNEEIGESEYLIKTLSSYTDWYYDSLTNQFGPKKFVGFKNMTAEKYEALKKNPNTNRRGNFDSSLTASILERLLTQVDQDKENELFIELEIFLANFDAHPRSNARVHLIR